MTAITKEVMKGASSALQKAMQGGSRREDEEEDLPDLVVMAQKDPPPVTKPTPKTKASEKEKQVEPNKGKPRSKADKMREEREKKDREHMEAMRKAYKPSDRSARMGSRQEKEEEITQRQKELAEKKRLNELEKLKLQRELKKKRLQKHIEAVTTRKRTDEEEREALRISAGNQLKEMRLQLKETKEETNRRQMEERKKKREENLRKIKEERRMYEKWAETHDMRDELTKYVEREKQLKEKEQRDAESGRDARARNPQEKSKITEDQERPGTSKANPGGGDEDDDGAGFAGEDDDYDDDDEDEDYDMNADLEDADDEDDLREDEEEDEGDDDRMGVSRCFHCLNEKEAELFWRFGEDTVILFQRIIKKNGYQKQNYTRMVKLFRKAIYRCGTYTPIEKASTKAVLETIRDRDCVAWVKMKEGAKTGASMAIQGVDRSIDKMEEEKRKKSRPDKLTAKLTEKTPEERKEVKRKIKELYSQMSVIYNETSTAFEMIADLADDLDEEALFTLLESTTRPVFHLKVPMMERLCSEEQERLEGRMQRRRDEKIGDVIVRQNLPRPQTEWETEKDWKPTAALAAVVWYFLQRLCAPSKILSQDATADYFGIPRSTFHRIASGRRYRGGFEAADVRAGTKLSRAKKRKRCESSQPPESKVRRGTQGLEDPQGIQSKSKLIQRPGEEPSVFEIKKLKTQKSTGRKTRKGKGHGKGKSNRDEDDDEDEEPAAVDDDEEDEVEEREVRKVKKLLAHSSRPRRTNKGLIMRRDVTKKKALEQAKETQKRVARIKDDGEEDEEDDEDEDDEDQEEVDMEALMEEQGERGKRRRKKLGIMVHE